REERRHRGRHARPANCDPARPHEREGPGEDRAGPDDTRAARQVDLVLAHADPAWASRVHRAAAEVRDLCNKPVVSELESMMQRCRFRGEALSGTAFPATPNRQPATPLPEP